MLILWYYCLGLGAFGGVSVKGVRALSRVTTCLAELGLDGIT